MKIDTPDRIVYANIIFNQETGKKEMPYGIRWDGKRLHGENTKGYKTGDGLVVVDIDVKNFKKLTKDMRKVLDGLKPTVETARGYHYYFKHKNSSEFVNKAGYSPHVDVRTDGGVIFSQYKGDSDKISYKRVGVIHKKMPKSLRKLLLSDMKVAKVKREFKGRWEEIKSGQIHDGCISYIMRDIRNGLSYDEIVLAALEYVDKYLGGDKREVRLMMDRIKWGFDKGIEKKLETSKEVEVVHNSLDIGHGFSDEEVRQMLKSAQKGGALELERVMKQIKKKLKISMSTLREMLVESPSSGEGIQNLFKGEVFWAENMGSFVEVANDGLNYHNKTNFIQTVMSRSGFLKASEVSDKLHTLKGYKLIYNPTLDSGEVYYNGYDSYNSHIGNKFEKCAECAVPKTISKVLDNLFESDVKAREVFLNWLAYIIQTGKRTGVAWGFFGASGSGKGLMVDIISRLLGRTNSSINIGDVDLQSNFNSYVANKQFLHLNEIASTFHGRHGVAGKLKSLVSDPILMVNMKGMQEYQTENFLNIILNSNKPNPIEIDIDDRRWNMIVSERALSCLKWWKGDKSYQKALSEVKEFGEYLNTIKVDINSATKPMEMSNAKSNIIEQTTSDIELLANNINNSNLENLCEMLDVDEDSFHITLDELKYATNKRYWSVSLLKSAYDYVSNSDKPFNYNKYMVKPYIKGEKVLKKIKGLTIRGLNLTPLNN